MQECCSDVSVNQIASSPWEHEDPAVCIAAGSEPRLKATGKYRNLLQCALAYSEVKGKENYMVNLHHGRLERGS